jgi:bifunctional non-homologous end joining protein LigD
VTARYPELAPLAGALAGRHAVLDGEIVALDDAGRPSFQLLQRRMGLSSPQTIRARAAETPVTLMIFDLLALDQRSATELPYTERRRLLEELELAAAHWQTPGFHRGEGRELLEAVRRQGLEGIVAKRLESPYRTGRRSPEWRKTRLRRRQELVIGGWMPGRGGRSGRIGSLLVGYWDLSPSEAERLERAQRLVHAGAVGSGLRERDLDRLTAELGPLRRAASPFELGIGPKRPKPAFCEPRLVCEVEFNEWTREETLRQPSFKGLRDDIDPRDVVREPDPALPDRGADQPAN